jgi:hypothetical protein
MWQPVASGARHLQQFRRLEAAGDALRGASASGAPMQDARPRETGSDTLDVAGYRLSLALVDGLASASLRPPPKPSRLGLIHIGSASELDAAACEPWRGAGWSVEATTIAGPPFWRMQGCADVPALVEATVAMAAESA